MKTMSEIVTSLSDKEKIELVENWCQFEKEGVLGDCLLRTLSSTWSRDVLGGHDVTWGMRAFAFEAFRELAKPEIERMKRILET